VAILDNLWLAIWDSALLFMAGWLGWRLLARLKVPVASLLGGVLAVGVIRLLGVQFAHLPSFLPVTLQVILGILIGLRFKKEILPDLKRLALPALLVSVWMLASCFVAGRIFQRLTQVTPVTAILGSAPGGVAELTLLAIDLEADTVVVATLQMMRLMAVIFVIPVLAFHRARTLSKTSEPETKEPKASWQWSTLITLIIGTAGALIGIALNVPVPGLLGALFTVSLTSCLYRELPPLPDSLRVWTQIGIGGMVGINFGQETLVELGLMAGPVIATTAVVMGSGLILSVILKKLTGWDDLTCLLASAPGGVTQFFILAYELGADPLIVSLLQLARFLSILVILPLLLRIPL
jgi:membrane AbrB-like protein